MLVGVLLLLMVGALFTEAVGVHAVFGAFVLGAAMPRGLLSRELQRIVGPLTTTLLLPLFFVYSGLNTRITLVNTALLWSIAAAIFVAACAGKGLACWLAARLSGADNRDAMGLGTLMNARGLMELVLLEYRARARPDHADAVHDARADGDRHHADDVSALRPRLPASARARPRRDMAVTSET